MEIKHSEIGLIFFKLSTRSNLPNLIRQFLQQIFNRVTVSGRESVFNHPRRELFFVAHTSGFVASEGGCATVCGPGNGGVSDTCSGCA